MYLSLRYAYLKLNLLFDMLQYKIKIFFSE